MWSPLIISCTPLQVLAPQVVLAILDAAMQVPSPLRIASQAPLTRWAACASVALYQPRLQSASGSRLACLLS